MAAVWSPICEKHQEPLKLFCKDDETPICLVCDKSRDHEHHKVIPIEEVSKEYKTLIHHRLENLRKEREKILAYKSDIEKENQELLKQAKAERENSVARFRQLCFFLEVQEKRLLAQMDEVEKEIARKKEEHLARLSRELSSLDTIIREMERKCQQPMSELLQDVRGILQRSEKKTCENPATFPPELKWRIWDFCDINHLLDGLMKQFKDALLPGLQLKKANVILDPDTAHPTVIVSEDRRSLRLGDIWQKLPNNPERFDVYPFVLGLEGFRAGRHVWEVVVGSEEEWAVGVARKSVRRKGEVELSPEEGIWAVRRWKGEIKACNQTDFPLLPLSVELKRIRVSLNCEGGRMGIFDAERGTLLYAFFGISLAGETLLPFFYIHEKATLRISP